MAHNDLLKFLIHSFLYLSVLKTLSPGGTNSLGGINEWMIVLMFNSWKLHGSKPWSTLESSREF